MQLPTALAGEALPLNEPLPEALAQIVQIARNQGCSIEITFHPVTARLTPLADQIHEPPRAKSDKTIVGIPASGNETGLFHLAPAETEKIRLI